MSDIKKKPLSAELYAAIVDAMPIATVDFVVVHDGAFLLGKRKNKPAQGEWWVPGGRVLKNETQAQAIKRKLKEETGLTARNISFVGVFDALFPDSAFGSSSHSITLLYKVSPKSLKSLQKDVQHGEFRWFTNIDPQWHPYLKKQLRAAGFT